MEVKTIVWDVDDVLNDLTREWFHQEWLTSHPECQVSYADLLENPPHRHLGITLGDYLHSLDSFRLSAPAAAMRPDPFIIKWFQKNGRYYRHIALTARPQRTVWPAMQWMLLFFVPWFQLFGFVPSPRKGDTSFQPDTSKGDFLAWLTKADFFIDDSPENVHDAQRLGIQSFLVDRPWNKGGLSLPEILDRLTAARAVPVFMDKKFEQEKKL